LKKGWYWPILLVGLLASGVGLNLYFMSCAVSDPSFAVEPDYYAKAIAWDAHQAQAKENAELGWKLVLTVAAADSGTGRARVVVMLADREGRPVRGLTVGLEAFHNARASQVVKATLVETAEHAYAADVAVARPGFWEFRVAAARGTEVFTAVVDQDAPGVFR
jgi:nitrogen fixation protein FixH